MATPAPINRLPVLASCVAVPLLCQTGVIAEPDALVQMAQVILGTVGFAR